jgi:Ni/Co efflux regulator RcnB
MTPAEIKDWVGQRWTKIVGALVLVMLVTALVIAIANQR